ncbi:hypothetical protein ACRYCC_18130 [Actinomadura scrupuli]|uniref:hypothetical protein n=1 Tax=Actinomadura scrupuli TaxID=559629 RepID=UPI003D9944BF
MSDVFLFVISLAITGLGLAGSWTAFQRRGLASGMRGTAWSLVPMAAYLTGLTKWMTDLVLSPVKWAGLLLLGVSVLLYVTSGVMLRRGVAGAEGRAAAPAGKKTKPGRAVEQGGSGAGVDPDLADIEAILRNRGIS